ncbi:MAG: hypothetical protein OXC57_10440 [Rhodobacteraceae bacterium]|nr:hypothetical protein [Paracoccaceae bacterium]
MPAGHGLETSARTGLNPMMSPGLLNWPGGQGAVLPSMLSSCCAMRPGMEDSIDTLRMVRALQAWKSGGNDVPALTRKLSAALRWFPPYSRTRLGRKPGQAGRWHTGLA